MNEKDMATTTQAAGFAGYGRTNYAEQAPVCPVREGGILDRLRSTDSLLIQLHDEIAMLEEALSSMTAPFPESSCDKIGPPKPGSNMASNLADQNRAIGGACERIRKLRMALDL